MSTPILLPSDFKASDSEWLADVPPERGTLFGRPLKVEVDRFRETDDGTMNLEDLALIQRILEAFPEVLRQTSEALSGYESDDPSVLEHVQNPRVWLPEEAEEGQWTLVVERDDWPDYGWHIEFIETEVQEIWAGD